MIRWRTMNKIDTLSTIEGRKLLYKIFHELRYEKQLPGRQVLALTWRLCTQERELFRFTKQEVIVSHPLGYLSGTSLWMQEIVNRFYFSTVNSFVYLGAALLLVLIGIRRFSDNVSDSIVISGIVFEALMLVFMFVVMIFTPNDDIENNEEPEAGGAVEESELLMEVGEIARDFAAAVVQLENWGKNVEGMIANQERIVAWVETLAESARSAAAPNPRMIEIMQETNKELAEFKNSIIELRNSADELKNEKIENSVKKEIERMLLGRLSK